MGEKEKNTYNQSCWNKLSCIFTCSKQHVCMQGFEHMKKKMKKKIKDPK